MANEQLVTILDLDERGYVRGSRVAGRASKSIVDDINSVEKAHRKASSAAESFGRDIGSGMRTAGKFVASGIAALVALDVAMLTAGTTAGRKAGDFEALELALKEIEGSAGKAKSALEELREIARAPGLGVTEAIQTYSGLRRNGVDRGLAMSLTRGTGNAVATAGGGKEQLGRAGLAMGQIAQKPFLQGEELMQLTEAGIPAYKIIKELFNTSDTEELKRNGISSMQVLQAISAALAKMPRVGGGAKNAFENLSDSWEQFQISAGKGVNVALVPFINDISTEIEEMTKSGELETFGETWASAWTGIFDTFIEGTGNATSAVDFMMTSALAATYASRNLANNVEGFWDGVSNFIDDNLFPNMPKNKGTVDGGTLSPWEEAEKALAASKTMAENKRRATEVGRLKRNPDGSLSREVQLEDGTWVDQKDVNGRKVRKKGTKADITKEGGTGTPDPTKAELPKQTNYLREIAQNTKPIHDLMLGGGAVTNAAVNARNLGAWTGSQSKAHGFAAQMVNAIYAEVHGQFVDMARQRHLNPGAI